MHVLFFIFLLSSSVVYLITACTNLEALDNRDELWQYSESPFESKR